MMALASSPGGRRSPSKLPILPAFGGSALRRLNRSGNRKNRVAMGCGTANRLPPSRSQPRMRSMGHGGFGSSNQMLNQLSSRRPIRRLVLALTLAAAGLISRSGRADLLNDVIDTTPFNLELRPY